MERPEQPTDEDLVVDGRCDHDACRATATVWCSCLCGRRLCATHEFEERRAWQVRQGLALIRHRPEADRVRRARNARAIQRGHGPIYPNLLDA